MSRFPLLKVDLEHGPDGVTAAVRTPAKINLFLEVERRRTDGYHDVTTLLAAVSLFDAIRVRVTGDRDRLEVSGHPVPTNHENLVLKMLARLRRQCDVPPLHIELSKRIPVGSGMGGGSGNAAGMLAIVDALLPHSIDDTFCQQCAADIGSDVSFFLGAGVSIGRGRGDVLEDLPGKAFGGDRCAILLIQPNVSSKTVSAYARMTFPLTSPVGPITLPVRTFVTSKDWVSGLFNRFEPSVFASSKQLASIAFHLQSRVPGRWRMTGSGSAFFVVWPLDDSAGAATNATKSDSVNERPPDPLPQGAEDLLRTLRSDRSLSPVATNWVEFLLE